jgi:hypothetical protein
MQPGYSRLITRRFTSEPLYSQEFSYSECWKRSRNFGLVSRARDASLELRKKFLWLIDHQADLIDVP